MVPQCKYFPQNVTSLPKRAKIVLPHKANEKFVPPPPPSQYTESGWRKGKRPLSTLSLSYKTVYPGFPTGVANIWGEVGGAPQNLMRGGGGLSQNMGEA